MMIATMVMEHVAHSGEYRTGWNDVAHGLLTWTDGCCQDYANPIQWINKLVSIARLRPTGEYQKGTIAACNYYREHGTIERMPKATWE